jgi:hypothetical protein
LGVDTVVDAVTGAVAGALADNILSGMKIVNVTALIKSTVVKALTQQAGNIIGNAIKLSVANYRNKEAVSWGEVISNTVTQLSNLNNVKEIVKAAIAP